MDTQSGKGRIATHVIVAAIGLIGLPEAARWLHGGAFAQSQPTIPPPAPTNNKNEGGNCNFPGGTNSGSINCGNTTNNFNQEQKVWRGWLEPSNDPTPPNICEHMQSVVKEAHQAEPPITILFADNAMISGMPGKTVIFLDKDCPMLSMQRGPDGIMVDASIADPDGHSVGTIVNNGYNIPKPDDLIVQPSGDLSTLVVHNSAGHELLFFHYINPNTVKVRGVFACPTDPSTVITVTDSGMSGSLIGQMHHICIGDSRKGFQFN